VRFSFIATEKACYPVALMCRVLQVSRSGYYAWRQRPAAERRRQDQRLALAVAAIHAESRGRYGSPRVHAELRQRGQRIARKRVARLMRTAGLRARVRRRFRCTTDAKHAMAIKGNLAGAAFRGKHAQRRLGQRHHLSVDPARLVVSGGSAGLVLAPGSRLVAERAAGTRARTGCTWDGA